MRTPLESSTIIYYFYSSNTLKMLRKACAPWKLQYLTPEISSSVFKSITAHNELFKKEQATAGVKQSGKVPLSIIYTIFFPCSFQRITVPICKLL